MPIPILNSLHGAPAAIYLDFAGDASDHATPAYQYPDAIAEIFARVSEKFSPFNINVTTMPMDAAPGKVERVLIGGDGAWTGTVEAGQTNRGGFYDGDTAYVFPLTLGNDPHNVAEAIAHEAGHGFGLTHHSVIVDGKVVSEYDHGNSLIAPIMGTSYSAQRGLWSNGPADNYPDYTQDDLAVISGSINGFGYRPQDHGQDFAHAETITGTATGIIGTMGDRDTFIYHSDGGILRALLLVAATGSTLHARLELDNASGTPIAIAADASTLSQYLTLNLPAGDYYLSAQSFGGYGDVGSYTLTVPEPAMGLIVLGILLARHRRKP